MENGFFRIKPVKGTQKNTDVIIPVHWVIKEIIDKGFDWEKKVYDTKINKAIKPICMMAGIKNNVSVSRTEGGKLITTTHQKWELVTTHTARRSAATNMFKSGIPSLSIMMITGHRTEKSFLKYIKISQEENAEILSTHKFFKKD
jgi:integrase